MPVVLSVYRGFGLGLALNPTPNPYRKPRVMSYFSPTTICGAGVPDEHNEAIPTYHHVINTHTLTPTFANVAQQSHKRISKLFRLQFRCASSMDFPDITYRGKVSDFDHEIY